MEAAHENLCNSCMCCVQWLEWKTTWLAHIQTVKVRSMVAVKQKEEEVDEHKKEKQKYEEEIDRLKGEARPMEMVVAKYKMEKEEREEEMALLREHEEERQELLREKAKIKEAEDRLLFSMGKKALFKKILGGFTVL